MNYFEGHYSQFSLPRSSAGHSGFYNNQLGALHAIAAHFSLSNKPALICMPTGSGKTAVLASVPFLLGAKRVLVLAPSKLVRGQIFEEFRTLGRLKAIGALHQSLDCPSVVEVKSKLKSLEDWEALRSADVIVATPTCVSSAQKDVAQPPAGFCDLVLVDEAHHAAAPTWRAAIEAFPLARRVLFTATPFRQDRKEVPAELIYIYPMRKAFQDGVFGRLRFNAVEAGPVEGIDERIALRAEAVVKADREAGLKHYLLVRAETKSQTEILKALYDRVTSLKLEVVHSGLTKRRVDQVLNQLQEGSLDGVVAVNLLSEGVDFPRLKVAAIHNAYKSLPITLQFIGRLARTNDPEVGEATFVGPTTEEMEKWFRQLYAEDAVWHEVVPAIADSRIEHEAAVRRNIARFEVDVDRLPPDVQDVSLYALEPFHSVRVWRLDSSYHIPEDIDLPGYDLVHRAIQDDRRCAILITSKLVAPKWDKAQRFAGIRYWLSIAFADEASGLLFTYTSAKSPGIHNHLAHLVGEGRAVQVPFNEIRRVICDLEQPRFSNIGMRNVAPASAAESYVIRAGSAADRRVDEVDARSYNLGHVMGSGAVEGERVSRGASSRGKAWQFKFDQVPGFIAWCREIAATITNQELVDTGTNLDLLGVCEQLTEYPDNLLTADWPSEVYRHSKEYQWVDGQSGRVLTGQVRDLSLTLDRDSVDGTTLRLVIASDEFEYSICADLTRTRTYLEAENPEGTLFYLDLRSNRHSFVDFLNEQAPILYCSDFSYVEKNQIFRRSDVQPFESGRIEVWDWNSLQVDIGIEEGPRNQPPSAEPRSIQAGLERELLTGPDEIVIFDHGSGEVADFVCVRMESTDVQLFSFYHCKKAGGARSQIGMRVEDVYEVCGQIAKGVHWIDRDAELLRKLRDKVARQPWRLLKGSPDDIERLIQCHSQRRSKYELVVVQPGLDRSRLNWKVGEVLGAADAYVRGLRCNPLRVVASD